MSNDLTYYERQKLEWLLRTKQSLRQIAKVMRRTHSALSKEIHKNGSGKREKYRADVAQRKYEQRKQQRRAGKLEKHPELCTYVEKKLRKDWSPEQIAGRLKKYPPQHLHGLQISHESIYYWIYEKAEKHKKLHTHLRSRKSKRQGQIQRKQRKKETVPSKISIHERPAIVNERKRFGDWESDTMEGTKQDKVCVSAQFERKSKLVRLHKVLNKSADETNTALRKTIDSLPLHMMHTITFDNGGESALHTTLRDDFGIDTYHCDAYCSWQKGGVENSIGLVRQYIPKKTPISRVPAERIKWIEQRLNNRPRKSLNYKTPIEIIHESGSNLT